MQDKGIWRVNWPYGQIQVSIVIPHSKDTKFFLHVVSCVFMWENSLDIKTHKGIF